MSGNIQTRFYYDKYGRRIAIKDPSAGIRRTAYDKAGNVSKETDADGRELVKEYDRYGRVVKQITPDLTTAYTYDDTENLLLSAVSSNGSALYNTYDEYGRLQTQREEAPDGKWLQKAYSYTTDGLPESIAYTSQNGALATEELSYRNGFLTEVHLADGTLVYRHDEENSLGQLTKLTSGGMQRTYEFNEWGLPVRRSITRADGSVMFDHSYRFNVTNNNLENRTDELRNLSEDFDYDGLNRLCSYGNNAVLYDNYGNIRWKGDAGELAYTNPNRPYAVTGLAPVEDNPVKSELDITYTAGERPSVITQDGKKAVLTYNANHDRIRMQYSVNDSTLLSRYYLGGNYEVDETVGRTKEKLYLGGGYYDAPAVLVKEGSNVSIYFIHRDYLGSILQIVDAQGNIVEENSFDAWGCRRNPANQAVFVTGAEPELLLGRGYTGHEHLSFFGLINMNARLYDPVLGRFLSPDPYVQMPDFTQAYNRYGYCMNSPLCYVDRNGEFWFIPVIIGAAVGMYSGGVIANKGQYNPVKWDWNSGKTWGYMFGGAVVGGVSGSVGGAIATSGIPMANTAAIAGSSLVNSVGTWAYTGGQTPISISFGAVSYDFTNGDFGYLGKKGNKWYENLGYGFGALANVGDAISLFKGDGQNIDVSSAKTKGVDVNGEPNDWWGHSAVTDEKGNTLISVGPNNQVEKVSGSLSETWSNSIKVADTKWPTYLGEKGTWTIRLNNISKAAMSKYASGITRWDLLLNSCVGHTSRGLWAAGVPNIYMFHPHLLNAQLLIRQIGIYSSPYIYQIP
mgnify:FL=1